MWADMAGPESVASSAAGRVNLVGKADDQATERSFVSETVGSHSKFGSRGIMS